MSNKIIEFTESAGKFEEVEQAMVRLTENIGVNSQEIMNALRSASKGAVTDYELMLASNKAMSLGVAKNTEEFSVLMEIARNKAKNMGISTTQAFNDIVTGLGRWSAMILDNLGITINAQEAQEAYAQSIGKTVSQLTESEKKQALINKVVSDGKKELEAMGEVAISATERKAQLMVSIDNLTGSIGMALLPAIETITASLVPLINWFTQWAGQHPELIANITLITTGVAGLVAVLGAIGLAVWPVGLGISMFSKVLSGLAIILPAVSTGLASVSAVMATISRPIWVVIGAITALGLAYTTNFLGFRDAVHSVYEYIKPIFNQIGDLFMTQVAMLKEVINFIVNVFQGERQASWENIKLITQLAIETIIGVFGLFGIDLPGIFTTIKETISKIWTGMFETLKSITTGDVDRISNKIESIRKRIKDAQQAIAGIFGGDSGAPASATKTARSIGQRASGGMVLAGQLYRVNELGTEYFRPSVNGTISRSNASSPNIQLTFGDVHIHGESDMNDFADKVRSVMMEAYRNISLWTY